MGINSFEGVGPEWLLPKRSPCLRFGREQDLKGERGKPIYWCMPIELSLFFPQSPLFSSLFSFLSFFFSFYSVFLFYSVNSLFFDPPFRARQGPFYSAYRDQCFTTLPLNRLCLVWAYLPTTKGFVCVSHPCQTQTGLFHSLVRRSTLTCHSINALSLYPQGMHLAVPPSTLPLLGGLSSQQDVPPKRAWAGAAK